ncbi:hypothetical protein J437_LFUL019583 [Ladona fulva]|uniref:ubiquitinyl hydrolase 1 n=1 Tax=Ladona fulva TaxID=123851 RepID=A0A8K0PBB5_LADFU|nr:hypothetical protein J437_LFUL019583 [Ladona fulva]
MLQEKVLEYKARNKRTKETLLTCLADLFYRIATQKKKVGSIAPKKFIARLRKEKEEFDNYMQQDAHEFLNFLINRINEIILGIKFITFKILIVFITFIFSAMQPKCLFIMRISFIPLAERHQNCSKPKNGCSEQNNSQQEPTWVHEIFQGILTSETRCLNCETFINTIYPTDFLCIGASSFLKINCYDGLIHFLKRMRVKKLPMILALHLKRFKYMEQYNRHIKVSHRVVFPLELRLFNTAYHVLICVMSNKNDSKSNLLHQPIILLSCSLC